MFNEGRGKRCWSRTFDLEGRSRQRNDSSRLLRSLGVLLAVSACVTACQYVGGIDTRRVDPALYDAGTDGGGDAEPAGCTFADQGDAAVRFVNAAPGFERVDLCVRRQGEEHWQSQPLTRGHGTGCPDGVGYKQVTASRALPTGTFDLKVIASSDADCDAPGLVETSAVSLEGVTTVIHASNGGEGALVALPESPAGVSSMLVRFVNLMDGVETLDVFLADTKVWPPEPGLLAVSPLKYGTVATEASNSEIGDVNSNGYVSFYVTTSEQTFGVLAHSDQAPQPNDDVGTPWLSVVRRLWLSQEAYSVFAVGRADDPEFPPELIDCLESDDDEIWTECRDRDPVDLSVSVLHTTLSGVDYPYYRVRAAQMGPVVAEADTDVMCLAFVMSDDDKRSIEEASRKAGFDVAWAEMDLNTPIDDPRRYDGTIPDPPSGPPCEGDESLQVVANVIACAAEHCTGGAGREGGIQDTGCLADNCILALLDVFSKPEPQQQCGMCLLFTMLDETPLERVEELCTTDNAAGMAFGGSSGVMLLSRLPIRDIEHRVLPSWIWRASVTKATVDLPNQQAVDVYCTQFSTSERAPSLIYVGPYGDGPLDGVGSGWTNAALLQAQRVMEFVRERSGPRPAIVAGGLETGLACPACLPPLDPFGSEVLADLTSKLSLGVAPDYTWQCLECGDNALRALEGRAGVSLWTDHILLHNFAKTDVVATSRIFDANAISIPVEGGIVEVPPSSHYGLRSVVRSW
jgi:hypothetical protein